jgi:hypothetical protein
MTMTEDTIADLRVRDDHTVLSVRLPWYRSLPLSCVESVAVAIDGRPAPVLSVAIPGFTGTLADATQRDDLAWDLRDQLTVTLGAATERCRTVAVDLDIAVRIPYIQQAPGVPLVQRAVTRTEATTR